MTIIHLITKAKALEEGKDYVVEDIFATMPFIEAELPDGKTSAEMAATLIPPRYLKSHLPYPLWKNSIQKHPELKIIQTIRNPKDTLVSYYHQPLKELIPDAIECTQVGIASVELIVVILADLAHDNDFSG